jgi:putative NADPH-quinone reductase
MNILIVLAHPDSGSFNHAIANTCYNRLIRQGHTVVLHDLYAEKFDPVILYPEIPKDGRVDAMVKKHCVELANSDAIIIVHPNWWGQPPAILKGWIDRVIRPGVAYAFEEGDDGEGIPTGLLKAETAIVINTSNTSETRETEVFKDPLETLWKNCIFDLCGVKKFYRNMFRVVVTSTEEQRKAWLNEVEGVMDRFFEG